MGSPAHSPAPARSLRGRALRAATTAAATLLIASGPVLLASGCGNPERPAPAAVPMVTGRRAAPLPPAQLAAATDVARRFARVYVPTIYLARRPRLPGTTAAVRRALSTAAARVPDTRRRLRPHVAGIRLAVLDRRSVEADVRVVDGQSPAFSVGITLAPRPSGWTVVSISAPG